MVPFNNFRRYASWESGESDMFCNKGTLVHVLRNMRITCFHA